MRIISQDGTFDLPYDKCVVWINDKKVIEVSPIGEPDSNYTFASYSTPEKAEKAMQLLREAYIDMPIILQNTNIEECDIPKMQDILKNSMFVNIPNEPPKVEYNNKTVFQFPKEEDL